MASSVFCRPSGPGIFFLRNPGAARYALRPWLPSGRASGAPSLSCCACGAHSGSQRVRRSCWLAALLFCLAAPPALILARCACGAHAGSQRVRRSFWLATRAALMLARGASLLFRRASGARLSRYTRGASCLLHYDVLPHGETGKATNLSGICGGPLRPRYSRSITRPRGNEARTIGR